MCVYIVKGGGSVFAPLLHARERWKKKHLFVFLLINFPKNGVFGKKVLSCSFSLRENRGKGFEKPQHGSVLTAFCEEREQAILVHETPAI